MRALLTEIAFVVIVAISLFLVSGTWGPATEIERHGLGEGAHVANSWIGDTEPRSPPEGSWKSEPLSRFAIGVVLVANPTDDDDGWARGFAALLLALSWWALCRWTGGARCSPSRAQPWLLLAMLLAMGPFRSAAAGLGVGALVIAVSTGAGWTLERISRAPSSIWWAGAIWGVATLAHPAGVVVGVPLFAFAARAYARGGAGPNARAGDLPLPAVPLSVLASPLVALLTVLLVTQALGTSMGEVVGRVDELWRAARAPTLAAGHLFDQSSAVAPSPGGALWEGLISLSWPWVLLGLAGAIVSGRDGGRRAAIGVALPVLLAGALDGDLRGPSSDLSASLVPVLAVLGARVARRAGVGRARDPEAPRTSAEPTGG